MRFNSRRAEAASASKRQLTAVHSHDSMSHQAADPRGTTSSLKGFFRRRSQNGSFPVSGIGVDEWSVATTSTNESSTNKNKSRLYNHRKQSFVPQHHTSFGAVQRGTSPSNYVIPEQEREDTVISRELQTKVSMKATKSVDFAPHPSILAAPKESETVPLSSTEKGGNEEPAGADTAPIARKSDGKESFQSNESRSDRRSTKKASRWRSSSRRSSPSGESSSSSRYGLSASALRRLFPGRRLGSRKDGRSRSSAFPTTNSSSTGRSPNDVVEPNERLPSTTGEKRSDSAIKSSASEDLPRTEHGRRLSPLKRLRRKTQSRSTEDVDRSSTRGSSRMPRKGTFDFNTTIRSVSSAPVEHERTSHRHMIGRSRRSRSRRFIGRNTGRSSSVPPMSSRSSSQHCRRPKGGTSYVQLEGSPTNQEDQGESELSKDGQTAPDLEGSDKREIDKETETESSTRSIHWVELDPLKESGTSSKNELMVSKQRIPSPPKDTLHKRRPSTGADSYKSFESTRSCPIPQRPFTMRPGLVRVSISSNASCDSSDSRRHQGAYDMESVTSAPLDEEITIRRRMARRGSYGMDSVGSASSSHSDLGSVRSLSRKGSFGSIYSTVSAPPERIFASSFKPERVDRTPVPYLSAPRRGTVVSIKSAATSARQQGPTKPFPMARRGSESSQSVETDVSDQKSLSYLPMPRRGSFVSIESTVSAPSEMPSSLYMERRGSTRSVSSQSMETDGSDHEPISYLPVDSSARSFGSVDSVASAPQTMSASLYMPRSTSGHSDSSSSPGAAPVFSGRAARRGSFVQIEPNVFSSDRSQFSMHSIEASGSDESLDEESETDASELGGETTDADTVDPEESGNEEETTRRWSNVDI